jgi:hypothetical protein
MASRKSPPRKTVIKGQDHILAYITPAEAKLLKAHGGSGKPGPMGIPSFDGDGPDDRSFYYVPDRKPGQGMDEQGVKKVYIGSQQDTMENRMAGSSDLAGNQLAKKVQAVDQDEYMIEYNKKLAELRGGGGDTGDDAGGDTGGDTGDDAGGDTGGDTGDDAGGDAGKKLSKEILESQVAQSTQSELKAQQKIVPGLITEQTDEILTDNNVKMSTIAAPVPSGLSSAMYNQTAPTAQAANQYQAAQVTQPANMQAAQGTVNPQALVNAAQGTLSPGALATAQTATMDPRATTQYQMGQLMSSIQAGQPLPAWASPQVRKVSAIMQQRGLGSSSMAAAAMVQAVTESGIEIAKQDADKYATLQLANLSNQQQAELQNAVALANMDMANLNNRQTAAVQNAKTFLAIDTQNLTNQQAAATINYQSKVQMKLSDMAAKNAARQFNAKSSNEVDMFFAELGSQIESANKNRAASIDQFNVNQTSAMQQFNASMEASRQQFNANMQSTIDQSNVAWRRQINTANTATQNAANQQNVQTLLSLNQNSLNNLWQMYRDQASWAMQASENDRARAHNAAMQAASIDANSAMYQDQFEDFLITRTIDSIFDAL